MKATSDWFSAAIALVKGPVRQRYFLFVTYERGEVVFDATAILRHEATVRS